MGSESSEVKTASEMEIGLVVEQRLNLGGEPSLQGVTTNRCDLFDQKLNSGATRHSMPERAPLPGEDGQ